VSRRKRRDAQAARSPGGAAEPEDADGRAAERGADVPADREPTPGLSLLTQVALLVAIFVVTTLIADLAGAANLGVAAGIGQVAFAIALVALLLRSS
jgi:hypothetical protein